MFFLAAYSGLDSFFFDHGRYQIPFFSFLRLCTLSLISWICLSSSCILASSIAHSISSIVVGNKSAETFFFSFGRGGAAETVWGGGEDPFSLVICQGLGDYTERIRLSLNHRLCFRSWLYSMGVCDVVIVVVVDFCGHRFAMARISGWDSKDVSAGLNSPSCVRKVNTNHLPQQKR